MNLSAYLIISMDTDVLRLADVIYKWLNDLHFIPLNTDYFCNGLSG